VPVGDPAALAAAIRALRDNPESRERVAAAGHARFHRDYGERALARRLRGHLDELVAARAAGRRR
jgi:glycosyltransferase involved in cell wall biosynthesis